jgi:DNA-binding MarR family transcriptional regulator
MFAEVEPLEREPQGDVRPLDLPELLSKVLLALTLDFERESDLSLPMSSNALRVLDEHGVRVRDLPGLTGTSKEAVAVSVSFLEKNGYVAVVADPSTARTKLARLTEKGSEAQSSYHRLLGAFEERWKARFGADDFRRLRDALETIVEERNGERPRMAEGLRPHPGGWRERKPYATQVEAMLRNPREALPHYPMVLHRGGWPDGSCVTGAAPRQRCARHAAREIRAPRRSTCRARPARVERLRGRRGLDFLARQVPRATLRATPLPRTPHNDNRTA